jgi:hypothetical protein
MRRPGRKLHELVREIDRLLEEKKQRLQQRISGAAFAC